MNALSDGDAEAEDLDQRNEERGRENKKILQRQIDEEKLFPIKERPPIDLVRLEEKKRTIGGKMLPEFEFLKIAAMLAQGQQINEATAEQIARNVFVLSKACKDCRQKEIERQAYLEIGREKIASEKAMLPKPSKYPATFDDFLRLLIGGKYKDHREKTYRDYARDMIHKGYVRILIDPQNPNGALQFEEAIKSAPKPSLDDLEMWMKDAKCRVYKTEEDFLFYARMFLNWYEQQPKEKAKKAAKARWEPADGTKQIPKKRLAERRKSKPAI